MRTIPKKNYVILGILTVVTILAVLYICKWYKASQKYSFENSVMKNLVGEIKETEFDNYILENPDIVIYLAGEQTEATKKFEKNLENYISKQNLKSNFIYLNYNEMSEKFLSKLKKIYFSKQMKNISISYPNLLIVEDGIIIDILYQNQNTKRDIKDVKLFLQKNGVLDNA